MNVLEPHPSRIGPYEVGRRIAGGGMASIHLGRSILTPHEVVALKVIRSELIQDLQYIDMFRDEATILSRMSHPHIVRTLEFGVTGHHRYIAMELLLGRTVAELFDQAAQKEVEFPPPLVAWLGARVASALHYAHTLVDDEDRPLHIVHRDANPANIFVGYDGDVKLIDFGLAKSARRFAQTQDGIVKGKVPYLAPEQILEEDVDARSDIFTIGASLWEALTRRRLFKRDNDLDTIRAIRDSIVPPLPQASPNNCPPELGAIVMKALAPLRADRFQTAAELESALDGLFGGRNDEASRKGWAEFVESLFPGEREAREAYRTQLWDEPKSDDDQPCPAI